MVVEDEVEALRVSDEAFLVASLIDRCPKTMMIRELFQNALEAVIRDRSVQMTVEFRKKLVGGVPKLAIWNSGPGMSSDELHHICDLAASVGKEKGLDQNFGMGAKVASLPSNRYGLRYRSCKSGLVSEVVLCERNGIYGRLRRELDDGSVEEVIDVTATCADDADYDLSSEWTEVLLLGNERFQNTVQDPYNGDPQMPGQWLADGLYHRFFRLPDDVKVKFLTGTHKLAQGARTFRTIPDRAFPIGRHEQVTAKSGIKIHYFYDPPLVGTSHNMSVSGAITTDVSVCSIVYKNEMYDVRRGRQWTFDSPLYGISFGAKHISVHVELPDDCDVRPEAYRQYLRYTSGDQRQVHSTDFAEMVREHRPQWLIDLIKSLSPEDPDAARDLQDELQRLLNRLRVRSKQPVLASSGDVSVERIDGHGLRPEHVENSEQSGGDAKLTSDNLLAVPSGAKRASISTRTERAPTIIPLHDPAQIEEKGIKGKAARFYADPGQLYVNMRYSAVEEMKELLELEYVDSPDPELLRKMALELSERSIMTRTGRAVVYALAKKLNREWSTEDMAMAQSPESLSLAADDFVDGLQNARRRLGKALRVSRKQNDQLQLSD